MTIAGIGWLFAGLILMLVLRWTGRSTTPLVE
jgi:hypothetical protein